MVENSFIPQNFTNNKKKKDVIQVLWRLYLNQLQRVKKITMHKLECNLPRGQINVRFFGRYYLGGGSMGFYLKKSHLNYIGEVELPIKVVFNRLKNSGLGIYFLSLFSFS
jgi:hypothetical protein